MFVNPQINFSLLYLLVAIPYAWLGLLAWHRRGVMAAASFAWMMFGMSLWSFTYSLELFFPSISAKIFFTQIEYIGIVISPVFMLFFAFDYTGNSHVLTPRARTLIWFIPILTLFLVWTNPTHHLMWDGETLIQDSGMVLLSIHNKPFFWIHALYSYFLLLVAGVILIMEFISRPGIYRAQISLVILSILSPMIGSMVFVAGIGPIKNLDLTTLFFLPAAIGLFWAIVYYRLLDILPTEHLAVIRNIKDAVIVLDSKRRILFVNPIAENLLSRSEKETVGQPLAKISNWLAGSLEPHLSGGERRAEIDLSFNGDVTTYEATISPLRLLKNGQSTESTDHLIILHDITERKASEMALTQYGSIMSSISHAAERFLQVSAWEQNIPAVLERLGQAADVSRVFVVMNYIDGNKTVYSSLCYEWTAPGVGPQIGNPALQHVALKKSGFARWEETLSEGLPICGLVRNFPEAEREFFKPLGSLSVAVIPIFAGKKWWGFLMFDECRLERQWSDMELDAFHAAASIFGTAESRARAEQKVVHRQHALNLLNDIVKASLEAGSVERMAQTVVGRLGELIGADGCFMTLWDPAAERTIPVAAYGLNDREYTQILFPPNKRTFTKSVLEEERTLVIEDTSATPYADQSVIHNFSSVSVLALPLIAENKKLGAVLLTFNKTHRFTTEEITTGEQAAKLLALALEKYQAMDDAKHRAETSETLRKAGLAVAEQLELDQTVNRILDHLKQVVPYDSASVQMLDGEDLVIVGGHGWENPQDVIGIRFPVQGDNPNRVVIETGTPYYLPEANRVYEAFKRPPHDHIRSWLGVPLIAQNRIIGLLAIDSSKPNDFDDAMQKIASQFADQVAVTLENARLHREAQTLAITDSLTGVYNRRGLFQLGEFEFQRARRISRPFSILMFDIDHFKKVNDRFGHAVGDQVLHQVAQRCLNNSRATDLVGRYGGEEFVMLLTETNLHAAHAIAERLRRGIMKTHFPTDADSIEITISIGVCEAKPAETLNTLIERADAALYQAKNSGRNRIIVIE